SFHAHNARLRVPRLLSRLRAGARVALVSDAGTPGVSDPGVELVAACIDSGVPIDPIPGPTAPWAAAVASGFPLVPFAFLGFPPTRSKTRLSWLEAVSSRRETVCFFEAPHRIVPMLREAAQIF